MKKIIAMFILFIPLLKMDALGQNNDSIEYINKDSWTKVDLHRSIKLDNDSKSFEILINIKSNVQRFELWITSSVNQGKLSVEIYNPNNVKQGNFVIGTQLNSELEEEANGNIRKSLFEPQSGDWKVKINPKAATGTIRIRTAIREY